MKKVLLLGGSRNLIPVIDACHQLGYSAITCDYLPNNYAHAYADEYHNVSIIEKDAVLELAKRLQVDGILSFACDPGVETMAYVCEKLGLPCAGSYQAVLTLQNKALFRQFLTEHGFRVPKAGGFSDPEEALQTIPAEGFRFPLIVKPVDSAGSKGVTRIDRIEALPEAAALARSYSKTDRFIVEEFIEQEGYSSDSDCFSVDGELRVMSFSNQRFDPTAPNPYTPAAYSWPGTLPEAAQTELRAELQRLITLLGLRTSIYNVETRLGKDGHPYLMEVSPRGGGPRLAELLRFASGSDLILNAVRAAVGDPIEGLDGDPVYTGKWAHILLHAEQDGIFEGVSCPPEMEPYIVETDLWIRPGEEVHGFTGANHIVGILVLRFPEDAVSEETIDRFAKETHVTVK